MSLPKLDLKQALDLFKWMNRGGILGLVPIIGVTGFMLITQCGPVLHSTSYGDENLLGQVEPQDHPEEMVAQADHGHDEHADEEHAEGDDSHDEGGH
ncbi:MAG: hypothetical protein ACJAYU_005408 [Bradymonadia bacterium]|jgi:hypothetical protein